MDSEDAGNFLFTLFFFWALMLLLTCAPGCTTVAPEAADCVEFNHGTFHNGTPTTCHMLWCVQGVGDSRASGLAALWCE